MVLLLTNEARYFRARVEYSAQPSTSIIVQNAE